MVLKLYKLPVSKFRNFESSIEKVRFVQSCYFVKIMMRRGIDLRGLEIT